MRTILLIALTSCIVTRKQRNSLPDFDAISDFVNGGRTAKPAPCGGRSPRQTPAPKPRSAR